MIDFGVGVMHNTINSRFGPKPLVHADYMTGLACGADSFWVADHLNSVLPPSMRHTVSAVRRPVLAVEVHNLAAQQRGDDAQILLGVASRLVVRQPVHITDQRLVRRTDAQGEAGVVPWLRRRQRPDWLAAVDDTGRSAGRPCRVQSTSWSDRRR